MRVKIKVNSKQNQVKFGSIEKVYNIENVRELAKREGNYLLSGKFKYSGNLTYEIKDTKIITLFKENGRVVDFIISMKLISKLSMADKGVNKIINVLLDLSSKYLFFEKEEGFLLILEEDYPEELQKSLFVK